MRSDVLNKYYFQRLVSVSLNDNILLSEYVLLLGGGGGRDIISCSE